MELYRRLRKPVKRNGVSFIKNVTQNQLEAQRSGFELERKMEMTDTELNRRLRKPVKRNGVSFI